MPPRLPLNCGASENERGVRPPNAKVSTTNAKSTVAKADPVKTPKANAYTEAEDALLLTLVAEHGRADGLRQFVVQNGHRTQYGAECRLYRLTRKAAK